MGDSRVIKGTTTPKDRRLLLECRSFFSKDELKRAERSSALSSHRTSHRKEYLPRCENGVYVIVKRSNPDGTTEYRRLYVPCGTMSCPVCREKKRRKLYKLIKNHCPKKDFYMLTLTLRQNMYPLKFNWQRLQWAWDILLKRLRRINPNVAYFRVTELQKNGTPHIHALINTTFDNVELRRAWRDITGDSFLCRFERVHSSCSGYILKYFEQAVDDIQDIRLLAGKKVKLFVRSLNLWFTIKCIKGWELVLMTGSEQTSIEQFCNLIESAPHFSQRAGPLIIEYDSAGNENCFSFLSYDFVVSS